LASGAITGVELVDGTARLAAMNMLLHGIGQPNGPSLIEVRDSLTREPDRRASLVLANPPFGRSSSIRVIGGTAGPAARSPSHGGSTAANRTVPMCEWVNAAVHSRQGSRVVYMVWSR